MRSIILLLTVLSHAAFSQHFLVKKNGENVPYKKIKFEDVYVELTSNDKKKTKVGEEDIIGYYDDNYRKIYYRQPIVPDNETRLEFFPKKREGFNYLERVEAGRINLYMRVESSGSPGGFSANGTMSAGTATTTTYYYAEKGDHYKNVYITGLLRDKAEDYKALEDFVGDDEEISKKLGSDDFRLNEKNLLRLIQEYNIKHFEKVRDLEYKVQINSSYYTVVRPKFKEQLRLVVNDSLEYALPASKFPLPLALPRNVPSKVCVTWEAGSNCKIIDPCPFTMQYYELDYASGDKSFEIEMRTLQQFKTYMASVIK